MPSTARRAWNDSMTEIALMVNLARGAARAKEIWRVPAKPTAKLSAASRLTSRAICMALGNESG